MATFLLACFYALRVYLHGYCIVTFLMGMILSCLVTFFFVLSCGPGPAGFIRCSSYASYKGL
ncbi:hypothetical protein PHJA_000626300 [Phtheirospermum japonicum]|uniref:Uncharacterized protein n=1 Tax=Phtheirospermum japonicum TaxID=374723 RepID=A0A830BLU4_9LAMI|nr:hypothetical protein PHJA_000626300 [Phtheirospermum japonicum]